MRKLLLLAGIALIAGITSFAGVQAFTKSNSQPVAAAASACEGTCVDLTEAGMKPDVLAIKVGEFVQFNSKDGKPHNISLGDGAHRGDEGAHLANEPSTHEHDGAYSSGEFQADEAWRVQFQKAGTYTLHDHYNPKLFITVVVYEPGGDTTIR